MNWERSFCTCTESYTGDLGSHSLVLAHALLEQPCGRAVIFNNVQELVIYYTVCDAIGRQRESIYQS